ncbi:MAG: 4Fe-4S dicluster domain-containing protein, partial [Geminicoccaceae bacterium]|nr:4Fe-4S dicluster domain-containing protein [Geminicoccaceae bacterium]
MVFSGADRSGILHTSKSSGRPAALAAGERTGRARPAVTPDPATGVAGLLASAERCLTVQRPGVPCRACAEVCPTDALAPAERSLAILLDRCLRCGRCAAACPTEALAVEGFPEIAATATRIECGRVPPELRAPGTAVVPCLGGVRAGALRAHLARAEAAVATLVDRGWCADCPAGGTAEPWAAVVDRLDRELEELGSARRVEVAREPLPPALAGPPPAPPRT